MCIRVLGAAAMLYGVSLPLVQAQGIASELLIDSITVRGRQDLTPVDAPNPSATRTAEQLRMQNLVNPEDALQHAPNVTIRKRYIGDRNALIGGRSFSTLQAPRGLVFMDGYLLSNFLGRFDAPRWNMIAPEEIARVDVLYGPFSALYPGNSIGATVIVTTRKPDEFDLSVRTTGFSERFAEYGHEDEYAGYQLSAFLGDRPTDSLWWSLAANRQKSTSHPMQYYTVSADAADRFPAGNAAATPVTGVQFDRDPQGRRRAILGASAGAIDHTVQNQMKLRAGRAFGESLELEGFIAAWRNNTENENRTFLRDAAGNAVWSGSVVADDVVLNVPAERHDARLGGQWLGSPFAPSASDEEHLQWGFTLRTLRAPGWNGSLVYSDYEIREDATVQANLPDTEAIQGGWGTRTERDGTGWQTFELQSVYTPVADDWTGGAHALAIGYHQNEYTLANPLYVVSDWRLREGGVLSQNAAGKTRLRAVYLQDIWTFAEDWSLTLGVRYEDWRAFDGVQLTRAQDAARQFFAPATVNAYARRSLHATSPKASLAWQLSTHASLRVSAGRGVRFPTVAELFQGTATGSAITVNDPDLRAEVSDAIDLTLEQRFTSGRARLSFFEDDVEDSIFTQTNIAVTPNVTNVQNIGRVRTRGVELAVSYAPQSLPTISLDGSIASAQSKILENANNPTYIGNRWPRIPDWRGAVQMQWRPTDALAASLSARYSGRMYNLLDNSDVNPNVYGGASRFMMWDARVMYSLSESLELAVGLDNVSDERAYQSHPYPGRTALLEARYTFEGST